MKELSIEGKATRYDQAIKVAVVAHKDEDRHLKATLERIFPELKENEDEKIRESLLKYLHTLPNHYAHSGVCAPEWIAWLEKQGEHANFISKIQVGDKVTRNQDGVLVNLSQLKRVAKKDEKQGEQKPTDKVEPKFKVGDHIKPIDKCLGSSRIIEEVYDGWYVTDKGALYFEFEDNWELVEQKSAWSEKDETKLKSACALIRNTSLNGNEDVIDSTITFLKSLKDRYTWKPSDEQIEILDMVLTDEAMDDNVKSILIGLKEQLKKLKS